jgi:uncharacterized protein (TIGR00369 family)
VADEEAIPTPPPGFVRMTDRGPFGMHNGPYFHHPDGPVRHAFFVQRRHTNKLGLAHGGMLTAFMDGTLAQASLVGAGRSAVTIHLSVDFLQMARAGDWVIGEARLIRATRDLAFVEGWARVDGHEVVRASGVFKLMRAAKPDHSASGLA